MSINVLILLPTPQSLSIVFEFYVYYYWVCVCDRHDVYESEAEEGQMLPISICSNKYVKFPRTKKIRTQKKEKKKENEWKLLAIK